MIIRLREDDCLYSLSNEHPRSNYGIPVLVDTDGIAYGPSEIPPHNLDVAAMLGRDWTAADIVEAWATERGRTEEEINFAKAFLSQWPDGPQIGGMK